MGLGAIAFLKFLAPFSLYAAGIVCAFLAALGKIRWAVLLIVLLAPLRNVVDRLTVFPMGDQYLDILFAGALFGWLASGVFARGKFAERSFLNLISVFLILYTLISVMIGSNYLYEGFVLNLGDPRLQDAKNFCLMPILFFLVLNGIKEKKWVWLTFVVMCLAMVLMDYYTAGQVTWFSSLMSRRKIHGTFQFLGPNEVAAFYNVNCMVILGIYFFMKMNWKKIVLLGLFLANLYCMIFMYSRAAYGATAVGLFIIFALKNKKLLIPLFMALIFWQMVLPEKAVERFEGARNVYGEYEISDARRFDVWAKTVDIFLDSPIVGTGYGTFRYLGLGLGDTHNTYLKIAAEQGFIGLTLFGILILCFLKEGYTLYKKGEDEESKGLGLGFTVAVIVLLCNNLFGNRWSYFEMNAYFWVYAGLIARLNAIREEHLHPDKLDVQPNSLVQDDKPGSMRYKRKPRRKSSKIKKGNKFERTI